MRGSLNSARARPAALETLSFTLELLKRIPRGRKVSASEIWTQLAEAGFNRDLRTVQRQLDELSQHFDIDRDDRSKPYGYQWKPQARGLSLPGLNEKEALVLALAKEHLSALLPAEVMATMEPFFDQARSNLSFGIERAGHARAHEWLGKVRVTSAAQPLLPPQLGAGVFDIVSSALYHNRWLEVEYQNAAKRTLRARVMPLGMAQQGERLYLVCRFDGHDNERSLALHRLVSAQDTGMTFKRPSFNLAQYEQDGRFVFGEGKQAKLEFLVRKDVGLHLLESRLAADQTVADAGEDYRIRATVTLTARLTWWLRGFGEDLKVIAPVKLAREVHTRRPATS
ncbi:MAG: WYL domain-containing protein [Pseudomonadota bacterium]